MELLKKQYTLIKQRNLDLNIRQVPIKQRSNIHYMFRQKYKVQTEGP